MKASWKLWLISLGAVVGAWLFTPVPLTYPRFVVLVGLSLAVFMFGVCEATFTLWRWATTWPSSDKRKGAR